MRITEYQDVHLSALTGVTVADARYRGPCSDDKDTHCYTASALFEAGYSEVIICLTQAEDGSITHSMEDL